MSGGVAGCSAGVVRELVGSGTLGAQSRRVALMISTPSVAVLGSPTRTVPIAASLQRAGLGVRSITTRRAHRSPGTTSSSDLTVLTWPPGVHPVLESEIYGFHTGAMHVWWHGRGASVGPFVRPGFGPCPACLASAGRSPSTRGTSSHFVAWAAAWVALQASAVVEHGSTDLMGTSWTWHADDPGLSLLRWPWRTSCSTRGCHDS